MLRTKIFSIALVVLFFSYIWGDETIEIIKVSGPFALINKGKNQGVQEGQIYFVKRESSTGLLDVCKVEVFRTTANRAAIQQVKRTKKPLLVNGDKLFSQRELSSRAFGRNVSLPTKNGYRNAVVQTETSSHTQPKLQQAQVSKQNNKPKTQTSSRPVETTLTDPYRKYDTYTHRLKTPWITFHSGVIFPYADLGAIYSPSLQFGASYMVEAVPGFNLGIEASNSFFSAPFGNGEVAGAVSTSSSLLHVNAFVQKFFGRFFFLEAGGGLYRPKITTTSVDNFKTTFSSTNFGLFGGTGVFLPTSEYAGIMVRGRLHNYFDETKRQYFGLSGGFRFKVQ